MLNYIIIFVMTLFGSVASLFLKKASGANNLLDLLKNLNLYAGGGLYVASALMNIYVLQSMEYSVVLPLTSLTYVWTMILSYLIFKEKITIRKGIGVTLVVIGAVCVAV